MDKDAGFRIVGDLEDKGGRPRPRILFITPVFEKLTLTQVHLAVEVCLGCEEERVAAVIEVVDVNNISPKSFRRILKKRSGSKEREK